MQLPDGWYRAESNESSRLEKELQTELIFGHKLYSENIKVVAHRDGATDDVLCQHMDHNDLYTVVHLTWSMKPEIDTMHPSIVMHGTFQEFLEYESKWLN